MGNNNNNANQKNSNNTNQSHNNNQYNSANNNPKDNRCKNLTATHPNCNKN